MGTQCKQQRKIKLFTVQMSRPLNMDMGLQGRGLSIMQIMPSCDSAGGNNVMVQWRTL